MINFCGFIQTHRWAVEVPVGLLWGALSLLTLRLLFCPMTRISVVPTRSLPDYVGYSLLATLLRALIVAFALLFPGVVLESMLQLGIWPVFTSCPDRYLPGWPFRLSMAMTFTLAMEYWAFIRLLDGRLGFRIKRLPDDALAALIRNAQASSRVNPAVPDSLLRKICFGTSAHPKLGAGAISYGGLIARPRVILPEDYEKRYPGDLLIPVLLHEISGIQRLDAVFFGLIQFCWFCVEHPRRLTTRMIRTSAGKIRYWAAPFIFPFHFAFSALAGVAGIFEFLNSRVAELFCDTDVIGRFQPELAVLAVAGNPDGKASTYIELKEHARAAIAAATEGAKKDRKAKWHQRWLDAATAVVWGDTRPWLSGRLAWMAEVSEISPRERKPLWARLGSPSMVFALVVLALASWATAKEVRRSIIYHQTMAAEQKTSEKAGEDHGIGNSRCEPRLR